MTVGPKAARHSIFRAGERIVKGELVSLSSTDEVRPAHRLAGAVPIGTAVGDAPANGLVEVAVQGGLVMTVVADAPVRQPPDAAEELGRLERALDKLDGVDAGALPEIGAALGRSDEVVVGRREVVSVIMSGAGGGGGKGGGGGGMTVAAGGVGGGGGNVSGRGHIIVTTGGRVWGGGGTFGTFGTFGTGGGSGGGNGTNGRDAFVEITCTVNKPDPDAAEEVIRLERALDDLDGLGDG